MRIPLALAAAGLLAIHLPVGVAVAQAAIESQRVTFRAGADSTLLKGQLKGDQTVDYKLQAGAAQTLTVELQGSNPQTYFNVMAAGTDNALIPGTPYHASADVPCGSGSSGKAARCKASVIRRANNSGTVVVTNPEGQKRQFLFVKGKAVASDQPEKLVVQRRGDVSVLSLGQNIERYEIPDALVLGGVSPISAYQGLGHAGTAQTGDPIAPVGCILHGVIDALIGEDLGHEQLLNAEVAQQIVEG